MDKKLQQYARLIVKQGVNLSAGEFLAVAAPVTAADLVREVARVAYAEGCRKVMVLWNDQTLTRLAYEHQSEQELTTIPAYQIGSRDYILDNEGAYVNILSENPHLLDGIPAELVAKAGRASSVALKRFRESTNTNVTRWCLVAYPSPEWAKTMFPRLGEEEGVEKMWQYMHKTLRLDTPDPLAAWKEHENNLKRRSEYLNNAHIKTFHYQNSLGTDFTVGMPKGYKFTGAVEKSAKGVFFTANMPTEEVFCSPHRMTAEGTLVSALPLIHSGKIIENFSITFKKGRIESYRAERGEDVLKGIIETDEGSHYLGEIALVGYNSPIQNLKTLFYNTLFDENASCHFAIGRGFPVCLEGGAGMTREQLTAAGVNDSLEHVDFMVGTKDLSITALTEDGQTLTIFENGDWVI